jgi:hypothetical protein
MSRDEVYREGYEDFKRGGKRIPTAWACAAYLHADDDWFAGWDQAKKDSSQ